MDKNTFYELVDIETPEDFKFNDNIENLIESDEEWDVDNLSPLLIEISNDVITELIDEYFKSILDRLPDDETDLYTLIYNVSRTTKSILNADEGSSNFGDDNINIDKAYDHSAKRKLAYELKKFSDWFSRVKSVDIKNLDNGNEFKAPLRDAIGMITLEKLGIGSYSYNFDNCNDYELDEYILNLSDFVGSKETGNVGEDREG